MALWSNTDEASSAPKHTVDTTNGATGVEAYGQTPVGTFALDPEEAVTNSALAGWNLRTEGTGGREGRVTYQCLVAMGSIVTDNDTIDPDPVITIGTPPANTTVTSPAEAVFTSSATATRGATVSYQWSYTNDSGVTWTEINGATSQTLTVESTDSWYANGNEFRVAVSATGADTVTSDPATLTVN
jgi:hypothetical protein